MPEQVRAGALARRYADAYFALAEEAGKIPAWRAELFAATQALTTPEVAAALENPRISGSQRAALALRLLDGMSRQVRNLVRLLVDRRRSRLLPEVLAHYDTLADRASGVVRATVTTAVDVDRGMRTAIEHTLSERFGKDVQTEVVHDPSILGGLVVRVGDRVIDDSVRTHLRQLQAALA
ncbi:MAG: F0F1 ATP synthase subunit delta [Candidatus Dormibacteraeota bacterium]|nr:F0F1 ATP synthase subunit delta [Candidatus Dormibacteraeota bacterium]MBV8444319.1 F0F1 ATP synthase subunit delta [Candidatus Dormibacteraeota bacterium]